MEPRVTGSARPVTALGGDEPGTREAAGAPHVDIGNLGAAVVRAPPGMARLALQPREPLRRGRLTGFDGTLYERATKRIRDRDARSAESKAIAGR